MEGDATMKKKIIILCLCFLLSGCLNQGSTTRNVSQKEAERLIEQGATLIDVRDPIEYKRDHIEGAINIPSDEAEEKFTKLFMKDESLILYCQSGGRSENVMEILESLGYTNVYNLGSISNWKS